jgi:hypothetical protein
MALSARALMALQELAPLIIVVPLPPRCFA